MDIITSLIETQNETINYYDLNSFELSKSYGIGKWTIKQILVHLADADSVLLNRIKRIISEPKQVIWAFDQDLWCENLNYKDSPIEISKAMFLANRQSAIYLAKNHYDSLGNKQFVHSETGLRTLKDEFDKISSHNRGHLEQIKFALNS